MPRSSSRAALVRFLLPALPWVSALSGCGQPSVPSDVVAPASPSSSALFAAASPSAEAALDAAAPPSTAPASASASSSPPDGASPSATPQAADASSADDVFGGLALELSEADVVKLLGAPSKKSAVVEEGATGLWVSTWTWPKSGVTVSMAAEAKGRPSHVASFQLSAASKLKNAKGIGVASTRADVVRVFGPRISTENAASTRPGSIVVDSIYGGVIFDMEKDRVVGVFVGAGAE